MTKKMQGIVTMMPQEQIDAVDVYRVKKRIWSRGKAIRALRNLGLELEALVVHLLDYGSIKLGTPHSAKLIDILRRVREMKSQYEVVV